MRVLAVGRVKEPYLVQGLAEYKKRLARFCRLSIVELKEESFQEPLGPKGVQAVLGKEGERILSRLSQRAYVCALDRQGESWDSPSLAGRLQQLAVSGRNEIDFVVGGSLGLSPQVLQRADTVLSFSQFTFPHQLMRLILLEQIYRAFTISAGQRYHK